MKQGEQLLKWGGWKYTWKFRWLFFHPSCAQGPFTGTHWNIYLYPYLGMVSGPYAEGVRGMRSYPPFGAHYFKIMQFLVYTPHFRPQNGHFLKDSHPLFKRLRVSLGVVTEYLFYPDQGWVTLTFWPCLLQGLGPSTDCTSKKIPKEFGIPQKYPFISSYPKVSGL